MMMMMMMMMMIDDGHKAVMEVGLGVKEDMVVGESKTEIKEGRKKRWNAVAGVRLM